MKYSVEKPGSPSELAHHGVKGQKWGVRKEEDTGGSRFRTSYEKRQTKAADRERRVAKGKGSVADKLKTHGKTSFVEVQEAGSFKKAAGARADIRDSRVAASKAAQNASTKEWLSAVNNAHRLSPDEARANLKENQEKFLNKFGPSDEKSEHGLTDTQKKLLIGAGVGVGVIGAAYLIKKSGTKLPPLGSEDSLSAFQLKEKKQYLLDVEHAREFAGKHVTPEQYHQFSMHSYKEVWGFSGSGYLQPESFAREAFELPVGHTFHRISTMAEETFSHATYSTHSIDDFNRYMIGFSGEKMGAPLHYVTWQATKPIKVPHTSEVLDTLHEILRETHGPNVEHAEVMRQYQSMSGTSWSGEIPKKLLDTLRGKGYHAIVDEMDAGVIGDTPLVFFGTDAVGPKTTKPITQATFKAAEDNLKELTSRKFGEQTPYYQSAATPKISGKELLKLAGVS